MKFTITFSGLSFIVEINFWRPPENVDSCDLFIMQVVERSSLVSVHFREAFSHPYISFFHLLVNGFPVIREYGSSLYVGLARAVPPTNTNFQLLLLPTQAGMPHTNIITKPQYVLHHVKFLPVAANAHHAKGIDMYLELCIVGGQNEMQMK